MANEKRLIDANALQLKPDPVDNIMNGVLFIRGRCVGKTVAIVSEALKRMIDNAPTVDAVEVVRCKDCKKWKCHGMPFDITKGTCHNPRFHLHHGHVIEECFMPVTNETDFCSYGERKDNERKTD